MRLEGSYGVRMKRASPPMMEVASCIIRLEKGNNAEDTYEPEKEMVPR